MTPSDNNLADDGSSISSSILISTILSTTSDRDACLSTLVSRHLSTTSSLLAEIDALDQFRRECPSLYHKVRALFFLYALHRFHLPKQMDSEEVTSSSNSSNSNLICPFGYEALLDRRFDEAIDHFLVACSSSASANADEDDGNTTKKYCRQTSSMPSLSSLATDEADGEDESSGSNSSSPNSPRQPRHTIPSLVCHPPTDALSSALAKAYHSLALQTLADQVRSSVRSSEGNEWLFAPIDDGTNNDKAFDHPRRITSPELLVSNQTLCERTPVRMDLSHAGWSDIFFLGMDFPEGARVINCSVDLMVRGSDVHERPIPPVESYLRIIDEPGVLRLVSVDLKTRVDLTTVGQVFDFAADYVGLLKAGVVASGIIQPSLECRPNMLLEEVFASLIGDKGRGIEVVTKVNDIPKGSRLAVSTNLLGSIIAVCMRATGQTSSLTGPLLEEERRLVAARAILGEWLGGSGGGWQDSGGVWPGLKLITGVEAKEGDPEWGISRGRLLPTHKILGEEEASTRLRDALRNSLVLVHGGMSQNVGPILEMVTEKYLLRSEKEWNARHRALDIQRAILDAFRIDDVKEAVRTVAALTTENFFGPIRDIIPWASNKYTETIIERAKAHFGDKFWGFWMLGGMSGGGMGFIVHPHSKAEALDVLGDIMLKTKNEMEHALPFAMDPVVYDFSVNEVGTSSSWYDGASVVPDFLRNSNAGESQSVEKSVSGVAPPQDAMPKKTESLDDLLQSLGFDSESHEEIRSDLQSGAIGLAQNRLPSSSQLTDALPEDVIVAADVITEDMRRRGAEAIQEGRVAVVTLAAGVGSRWTQGAGCTKAIHPFCYLGGKHRSFSEVHLAKSRRISTDFGGSDAIPHIFTTSHMTEGAIQDYLVQTNSHGYSDCLTSHGKSIGLRMIPTVNDLRFAWEEQASQRLDEQAQKVKESLEAALIGWAESNGEGADYRDNIPSQCLCPVGHWFEVPNLLLNGTLATLLKERPQLQTLMMHNIDTVGADCDPDLLGLFLESGSTLSFEVVLRRIEDTGGGLGRVDGRPRLVEGLAMPTQDDELKLSYYNSMTTWVDIDSLLNKFGLNRDDLDSNPLKVEQAVHDFSRRMPTYVTLKDVKKRWGNGQEDVHPVAQFEKLWGDMSSLDDVDCTFVVVPRVRGQQLKDPAQLDGWLRDGSAAHLESLCLWE